MRAVAALLGLALLSGCGNRRPADRVVMAWESFPATLDPRLAQDQAGQRVLALTHQGLLKRDRSLAFVPDGCLAWGWVTPYTELRFDFPGPAALACGERRWFEFGPGRPLRAQDALASLEALRDPALRSAKAGPFKEALDRLWIEDEGERQVLHLRLKGPNPGFPANLARAAFSLTPAGETGPAAPGSGPYRMAEQVPEQRLLLVPKPGHPEFDSGPRPLALELRWMPDATTRLLALRHGTAQAALNNLPADLLRPSPRMAVRHFPGANLEYVAFRCDHPALKDARVRRALALATDREELVRVLTGGLGRAATAFYPPELAWGVNADGDLGLTKDPEMNRAAARRLLDEAGLRPGTDGVRLHLTLSTTPEVTARMKALILQAQWAKVGVHLDLLTREFGTLLSEVAVSRFEVVSLRWVGVTDPQMLMDTFHSSKRPPAGFNRGRFQDAEIDRQLEAAQAAHEPQARLRQLQEVQRRLATEAPYLFLYWPDQTAALAPELDIDLNAAGDFTRVWRRAP